MKGFHDGTRYITAACRKGADPDIGARQASLVALGRVRAGDARRRGTRLRVGLESASWRAGNDLPRLWEVPDFALIERSGQSVARADLLGKVWIASIIFTRCVEECPLVSSHMARLGCLCC